jgi:hypothetical protein
MMAKTYRRIYLSFYGYDGPPFSLELESYEAAGESEIADGSPRFNDIDDYFNAVEEAVISLPPDVASIPWRVIRTGRVGFYTFFKEVMWRDLDPERWPENAPLLDRTWVKAALAGREKVPSQTFLTGT